MARTRSQTHPKPTTPEVMGSAPGWDKVTVPSHVGEGPKPIRAQPEARGGVGEATPGSASLSSVIRRTQADTAMSRAGPATRPGVTLSLVPVNARPAVQSLCEPRGRRLQAALVLSVSETPMGSTSSSLHLSQCVPRWRQTPRPGPEETHSSARHTLSPSPRSLAPPHLRPRVCEVPCASSCHAG